MAWRAGPREQRGAVRYELYAWEGFTWRVRDVERRGSSRLGGILAWHCDGEEDLSCPGPQLEDGDCEIVMAGQPRRA